MTSPQTGTDVLRTLHRIHRQLNDLNGRLDRGPKQIHAAEAHAEHSQRQHDEALNTRKAARMASDAKQVQLKGGETKIEELKVKLNTASSNREYQALKDQLAAQQMTNSVLTDEILEGMDKIDELQQEVAETEAHLAKARKKSEEVRAEVARQEPLIRGDIDRLRVELEQHEALLAANIKELYGRVVRQRGEDALAAVEDQICDGCHQQVQLNVCAEVMLGRPTFCTACGRLLYVPEEGSAAQ